jgi:hypothetical protein
LIRRAAEARDPRALLDAARSLLDDRSEGGEAPPIVKLGG